ncbi:MAG: ATP-binding protein [Methanobrevibacter sp.]|nr:ATP-binding protein [Methanobrevibacter sp.]
MSIDVKNSPFQPGIPVSPNNFKGRKDIIEEIIRYFPAIALGRPQHFFILGERGFGKSSLAKFIINSAKKDYSMLGVHIMNDSVHTVDELIIQIIEVILNEIKSESWAQRIFDFFNNHIEKVGVGGLTIKFNPSNDELKNIKDHFSFYLIDLVRNFEDKKGLLIVIDDINGLSDTPEFANWYKSFVDTMATSYNNEAPIGIILTSYEEKFLKLNYHNPSFKRIFHVHKLDNLSYDEVLDFYEDIFDSVNMDYEEEALEIMTKYSSGMPVTMHEIGDASFWNDNDNYISTDDALFGVIKAKL